MAGRTAHIENFRSVLLFTTAFFANPRPAAWSRSGIASGNPFTVRALACIIPGHLMRHVRILRDRYF